MADHPQVAAGVAALGVVTRADWFKGLGQGVYLGAGRPAPDMLRVPVGDAQRILQQTARVVAGTAAKGTGEVVWAAGASELLVRAGALELSCVAGLITVGVPVACDQLKSAATVGVPFAVGTAEQPSGLVMATLTRPIGPAVVVDGWAEPITAFAWEALIHLAQSLCAATGTDSTGDPLIPGFIAAAPDLLLLRPMARHRDTGPVLSGGARDRLG